MVGAAIVGGDDVVAPHVAEVDTGTGSHTRIVGLALVGEGLGDEVGAVGCCVCIGSEGGTAVAAIGEGVGDAPAYVGLLHVGNGLVLQRVGLVEEEALLPVLELFVHFARVGECGSEFLDVTRVTIHLAAYPGTLGAGQHVGIHVVLLHDVLLGRSLSVVPVGRDGACYFARTLVCIVDVALVDTHYVCKHVEMVGVVVAAVDIGYTIDVGTAAAPHLCHVTHGAVDANATDGVPYHHLATQAMDMVGHDTKEVGVGDGLLVGTDMDVR